MKTDTAPMLAAKEMTYALYASETPPSGPWGTTCAGFRRKSPPTSFADAQRVPLSERCTKAGTRRYGERIDYIFVSNGVRVLDYATYNATKTLTLPGGATTAYSWGNALNGDKANCNGHFPCGTAVKGPCNEQQLDPATEEARLLFGGLSP